MFKLMKVFDCQDMPKEVKKYFFDKGRGSTGNDCYVDWYVYDEQYPEDDPQFGIGEIISVDLDCGYVIRKGYDLVSDWLVENGAENLEKVIIKHWW